MTTTTWHERAAALQIDGRAVINGERVWAKSEQRFDDISPVDGRLLGQVARCDGADVDAAVAAARAAFEDKRWSGKSPAQRKRVMIKFADLVQEHGAELADRKSTRLNSSHITISYAVFCLKKKKKKERKKYIQKKKNKNKNKNKHKKQQ